MNLIEAIGDPNYAWSLLQTEIALEMSPNPTGQQIANLLELYMRGVERMNSRSDQRQAYFKSKVMGLMTRQNVVHSFNNNSMKKKQKHEEVTVASKQVEDKKKNAKASPNLFQKKQQMEMRLAYQENSREAAKNILVKYQQNTKKKQSKLKEFLISNDDKLNERIKNRKLRAATSKQLSLMNSETGHSKLLQGTTDTTNMKQKPTEKNSNEIDSAKKSIRVNSLDVKANVYKSSDEQESPAKKRKSTFDFQDSSKEFQV